MVAHSLLWNSRADFIENFLAKQPRCTRTHFYSWCFFFGVLYMAIVHHCKCTHDARQSERKRTSEPLLLYTSCVFTFNMHYFIDTHTHTHTSICEITHTHWFSHFAIFSYVHWCCADAYKTMLHFFSFVLSDSCVPAAHNLAAFCCVKCWNLPNSKKRTGDLIEKRSERARKKRIKMCSCEWRGEI